MSISTTSITPTDRAIRARFSAAADRYEACARVQILVNQHLMTLLEQSAAPERILDIGCGTGILTRHLADRFPKSHLRALDFAPGMLAQARSSWNEARPVEWIEADIRSYEADTTFDLVVSGSCLQWVRPIDAALARIETLAGNRVLLAIMLRETLNELRTARREAAPQKPPAHPFYTLKELVTACEGFSWELRNAEERVYTETHASARAFLKSLHDLGVTGGSGSLLTRSELLALESVYDTRFQRPGGVTASYHIGFLDLVKRSD